MPFRSLPQKHRHPAGYDYLGPILLDDEYVVHVGGLHWIIYTSSFVFLTAGFLLARYDEILVALLPGAVAPEYFRLPLTVITLGLIGMGLLFFLFAFIRQISTDLIVTNQHVMVKHGLISTDVRSKMLMRVSSIAVEQSALGRLLGYGSVVVDEGDEFPVIPDVADPYHFYYRAMREIHHLLDHQKKPLMREVAMEKAPQIENEPDDPADDDQKL